MKPPRLFFIVLIVGIALFYGGLTGIVATKAITLVFVSPTPTKFPTMTPIPTMNQSPTITFAITPSASLTPTLSPTTTITLTPTIILEPSQTPKPSTVSEFEVIEISNEVSVGDIAGATIKTQPGASCNLVYVVPSGRISTAGGVGPQTADEEGNCDWSWKIGTTTKPGTGSIRITGNGVTKSFSIIIKP